MTISRMSRMIHRMSRMNRMIHRISRMNRMIRMIRIFEGEFMEEQDLSIMVLSGLHDEMLTDEEIMSIQGRLLALLGKRTGLYTMGDSSSVPIETAEELFRSICFTIDLLLKSDYDTSGIIETGNEGDVNAIGAMNKLLECDDLDALLKDGQKKIQRLVEIGKWRLRKAKESALPVDNISYQDTIRSIEGFFKKYDIQFFAHEIPCGIDYQLCHAVPEELQGIKYINEYLRRIIGENRFCKRFDSEKVIKLLEACCPDYRELLINIYEPVAVNALGIALLDDNVTCSAVTGLDITENDRKCLLELFQQWDERELVKNLCHAAVKVCNALHVSNATDLEYLETTAESLCPRILAALPTQRLDGIFMSLSRPDNGLLKTEE